MYAYVCTPPASSVQYLVRSKAWCADGSCMVDLRSTREGWRVSTSLIA